LKSGTVRPELLAKALAYSRQPIWTGFVALPRGVASSAMPFPGPINARRAAIPSTFVGAILNMGFLPLTIPLNPIRSTSNRGSSRRAAGHGAVVRIDAWFAIARDTEGRHAFSRVGRPSVSLFSGCSPAAGTVVARSPPRDFGTFPLATLQQDYTNCRYARKGAGGS
jgi:hypothetical protein